MKTKFAGVWATFEYLDDTCAAIKELKNAGFDQITTHTPCARHEIDHALGNPQSRVPFATLAGAFVGFRSGRADHNEDGARLDPAGLR